ncbi:MAG TPA: type II/IV secretion system protein, partial [Myxococcota bacterium]|nr:type II/IV secretion system protein [Myxococcota bacterium]
MADGREAPASGGVGGEARSPLTLEELLEILRAAGLVTPEQAREIAGRSTTLRSRVLKERVGSVRSQAAARYDATPAEVVAAADLQNAKNPRRKLDEDAVAEAVSAASGVPYLKLDPLRIDGDLIAKTMSRPFARRHAVIA